MAREIWAMMERTGSPAPTWTPPTTLAGWLEERFPTIHARCLAKGIDITREPILVVPATHYACGGVKTDLFGRTSLPGLWAVGEVASTGLHGSNRLASTSLVEGLVFGWRSGEDAARLAPITALHSAEPQMILPQDAPEEAWRQLGSIMWKKAGLIRTASGLSEGL